MTETSQQSESLSFCVLWVWNSWQADLIRHTCEIHLNADLVLHVQISVHASGAVQNELIVLGTPILQFQMWKLQNPSTTERARSVSAFLSAFAEIYSFKTQKLIFICLSHLPEFWQARVCFVPQHSEQNRGGKRDRHVLCWQKCLKEAKFCWTCCCFLAECKWWWAHACSAWLTGAKSVILWLFSSAQRIPRVKNLCKHLHDRCRRLLSMFIFTVPSSTRPPLSILSALTLHSPLALPAVDNFPGWWTFVSCLCYSVRCLLNSTRMPGFRASTSGAANLCTTSWRDNPRPREWDLSAFTGAMFYCPPA